MSHPNPSHDRSNEYPSDGFSTGKKKGDLERPVKKMLNISEFLTTDLKASIAAGKKNAKSAALKKKLKAK